MPSSKGTTFDIDKIRAETPGCGHVLHFNNAGAGLMPSPVVDTVTAHLKLEAEIGGYEAADATKTAFENTYSALAKFLNCTTGEIALMENATVAWQAAFYGLAQNFKPGDRILTAEAEYASNYIAYLQMAERTGVTIEAVPSLETGELDVDALENMIDERVKLIAITHVPTNGGLVNPAVEIGRVARAANIPYLLDACQAAGQVPLDVEAIGCDMLSATGRKYLRGPRGTGFLYVRQDFLDNVPPPMLDLHGAQWTARDGYTARTDARKFENWEYYVAGQIGLGVAVDYLLALGQDVTCARIGDLSTMLRQGLADIPDITLHDIGRQKGGIVSFSNPVMDPGALKLKLREKGINCSTSSVSSTRLDMEGRGLEMVNRASVHYYNTEDEVQRFCASVAGLIA
ncbi:MAG: aminotransferase class V-fold PLP-dependent enzyme [Rhodospirillaceae bacterium]|nr:aminotransferase class V-fold PLP-dependent enzyme [Rhodospirillaceae bacterium]